MSKISHLPKTLPSKTLPFEYNGVGELTGHKYHGSFVVTVPSTRDIGRIGVETARLSGGIPPDLLDGVTGTLNSAIAFLQVCLTEGPAWFVNSPDNETEEGISYGLDSHDLNVPIEIYKLANGLVEEWHSKLQNKGKKVSEKSDGQSE